MKQNKDEWIFIKTKKEDGNVRRIKANEIPLDLDTEQSLHRACSILKKSKIEYEVYKFGRREGGHIYCYLPFIVTKNIRWLFRNIFLPDCIPNLIPFGKTHYKSGEQIARYKKLERNSTA